MNRFETSLCRALFLLVVMLSPTATALGDDSQKPNVLFLLTDDQRPDTIAALGNDHIQTPNIDQLVHTGLTFHNNYCQGSFSGAVCMPSRYQLLSGRSLFRVRDRSGIDQWPTFPQSMNEVGYVTYHNGKRGNTPHEIHQQFDNSAYLNDRRERSNGFAGRAAANNAIEFIDSLAADDRFFIYVAFAGPHDPRVATDEYLAMYDVDTMPLPVNYQPEHPFDNGEMRVRDEMLAGFPRTEEEIRRHLRDYYAVITHMDAQIGRIFDALRESGRFDNTIIVFSSDHGLAIGSHGLMGKQNLYEHSSRAPLLFSGPGIPQGETEAMCYLYDIYPTICDLVGAEIPEGIDGVSLAPVIRGESDTSRQVLLTGYKDCQRAVRQGDWKLIAYPQVEILQLFHLSDDPHEMTNLAEDPAHAERLAEMTLLLAEQQKEQGDWMLVE